MFIASCSINDVNKKSFAELTSTAAGGYIGYEISDGDLFTTPIGSTAGLILGIVLSVLAVWYYKLKSTKATCSVVAITLVTNFLFYILHPKSDWMVLHLDSQRSREAWLHIYRTMQREYHIGFVIGIIAVGFIGNGICK